MGTNPRGYSQSTLKRLFGLSGNNCAFPGCTKTLVNQNTAINSNICHIEAAEERGERYNANMTDDERADYPNLILLCPEHHEETNDIVKYTVSELKKMKTLHESNVSQRILRSKPSMLMNAINAIANIQLDNIIENGSLYAIDPQDKILYNSVKRTIPLIHEYKIYHEKINTLYDELEKQGSIKKDKLLSVIRSTYLRVKGRYVLDSPDPISIIRNNSDNIIDDVYNELYSQIKDSNYWVEDMVVGLELIIVDAFIRCKLLEEPPHNDN